MVRELQNEIDQLSDEDRTKLVGVLAELIEKQSRYLGEEPPTEVTRILRTRPAAGFRMPRTA